MGEIIVEKREVLKVCFDYRGQYVWQIGVICLQRHLTIYIVDDKCQMIYVSNYSLWNIK